MTLQAVIIERLILCVLLTCVAAIASSCLRTPSINLYGLKGINPTAELEAYFTPEVAKLSRI